MGGPKKLSNSQVRLTLQVQGPHLEEEGRVVEVRKRRKTKLPFLHSEEVPVFSLPRMIICHPSLAGGKSLARLWLTM